MTDNIWADKFIKRETLPAGELAQRFNINNPRLHPESQRAATESSLDTVGWIDEVSLSTNGDGAPSLADNPAAVMFDGHERVEIALVRGGPDMLVPCRWYQLSAEETDFALLVKDQTSAMAQIDAEKMGALMERAKAMTSAPGLQGMMERLKEQVTEGLLAKNGDGTGQDTEPQIDRAEELQAVWQVQPGQLWACGEHRVICGDCREPETWQRLLDGRKVNGVFTSPPYAEQRKAQYGGIPTAEYVDWWEAVQANVRGNLADDGSFFVNIKPASVNYERQLYVFDLVLAMKRKFGWRFIDEFCWLQGGIPGDPQKMGKFKNQFEPIYHFAIGNYAFIPDAVMTESDNAILDDNFQPGFTRNFQGKSNAFGERKTGKGYAYPGNVVKAHGSEAHGHEAAFPVALPTFFIKAYSDPGDLWLDPFLGSGTTMIAAHNEGRTGYGIERLEKYCSVVLQRFLDHTGIQPELIETVTA